MTDTPTYDIAPDDAYIASTIAIFDPVADMPSNAKVIGNITFPDTIRLEALSPAMADPIRAAVAKVPVESRANLEAKMIREALEGNSLGYKVRAGLGEGANEYQRELCSIQNDVHELNSERLRLSLELGEVSHWTTVIDPATGVASPLAIDKMTGERRKGWEERIRLIDNQVDALQGAEGEFRKKRALFNSVEQAKAKRDQLDDHVEIEKRAVDMVREDRIKTAAESRFRMMRKVV